MRVAARDPLARTNSGFPQPPPEEKLPERPACVGPHALREDAGIAGLVVAGHKGLPLFGRILVAQQACEHLAKPSESPLKPPATPQADLFHENSTRKGNEGDP